MVGARAATSDDAAAVSALRERAREDAAAKRGGPELLATAETPGSAETATVVGTIGDSIVGFATLRRGAGAAELLELFTDPGARGVGVGDAMLGQVMAVARSWGLDELDSYALPGDRDTKNFFESHGMKSRLLVVRRSL